MDIDVSLVEDSRRLAKQCKMKELIEELENKCKKVYEFGETLFNNTAPFFLTCTSAQPKTGTTVAHNKLDFVILAPG